MDAQTFQMLVETLPKMVKILETEHKTLESIAATMRALLEVVEYCLEALERVLYLQDRARLSLQWLQLGFIVLLAYVSWKGLKAAMCWRQGQAKVSSTKVC